jgi:dTDP-4-amino-4,6-dideoxygalactose transaminase
MYKELTDHIQFYSIRKEALELKDNYINTDNRDLKSRYLDLFNQAEHILDENPNAYAIDNVSKALIQELDTQTLIKKRQSNFTFLLNSLKGISGIQPIFNELSSDSCPFFFPIYVKGERDNLRKKLINEDIYCPVHWPIPNQARLIQSSTSKEIYETIISLPCDQRYGLEEMKRLSNTLRSLFAI